MPARMFHVLAGIYKEHVVKILQMQGVDVSKIKGVVKSMAGSSSVVVVVREEFN
jgi:hypothetical protein